MSPSTDRLFSLRRMILMALAVVLTCLALTPSLTSACACTNGATRVVLTSIACCGDPRLPSRPGDRQTCQNCQWVTTGSGCFRASPCAF
ncbi:MAG TPA: hypothetical protein VF173_20355 [Thermoanaerobaculia bacterium]|nr:hypothetical protein [Thermoanaerobaculia bacterium]